LDFPGAQRLQGFLLRRPVSKAIASAPSRTHLRPFADCAVSCAALYATA